MNGIKSGRYAENPLKRLVDVYVLDVIGALPPEMAATAQRMDLQRVFKTAACEWREVLRETLNLSDTFDVAILDLWIRWNESGASRGQRVLRRTVHCRIYRRVLSREQQDRCVAAGSAG